MELSINCRKPCKREKCQHFLDKQSATRVLMLMDPELRAGDHVEDRCIIWLTFALAQESVGRNAVARQGFEFERPYIMKEAHA